MNLAIVSTNKNKYSETFIHNHVKYLSGNVYFLFDGYLPRKYSDDRGITQNEIVKRPNLFKSLFETGVLDNKKNLANSVKNYLKHNKIKAVLCEYGPSGVEMMEITQQLNIPLIVHFHGYDAYRKDVIGSYGKQYKRLFEIAKAVIVVSKHMYQQLFNLGCRNDKLHLLAYGVDIDFFKPDGSVQKKYDFVFCGRFVAKKSPLKIVESFAYLLKQQSNATLAMIGEGELYEEAQRLSVSLGVNNHIFFLGAINQNKVLEIYRQSKIFINHSTQTVDGDSEGTPVSIIEAMAAGLVVIASKHGGIKDVIQNGLNGFLTEEGEDNEVIGNLLLKTLSEYPQNDVILNGIKSVTENYNLEKYIRTLGTIISGTL